LGILYTRSAASNHLLKLDFRYREEIEWP
jgi:hypothetical protein